MMPPNTVLAGTLNSGQTLETEYIWHKVTDENKPGQYTQHS